MIVAGPVSQLRMPECIGRGQPRSGDRLRGRRPTTTPAYAGPAHPSSLLTKALAAERVI